MKTQLTYRPLSLYNREFHDTAENELPREKRYFSANFVMLPVFKKKGKQPAGTEDEDVKKTDRVADSLVLHKRHGRVSLTNIILNNMSKPVVLAQKLGKSFKHIGADAKENINPKKTIRMKTFEIKKILVPTDFSETGLLAIEHASFMARLCKAHLYILHVVETFEYAYSEYEPEILVKDIDEVQEVVTQKLEKLAASLNKQYGVRITPLISNGRPAAGIADTVKDNKIDLIVMGTHGAKGFEEYFVGSNAHKVVNISPCPVITVQAHAKNVGFTNIVMPIDNTLHSRQKVDYVIELASHYGAKVHILGLLDSNEEIDEKKFNIKLDSVEHAIKKAELPYTRKVVNGHNIAIEAMKYSEDVNADLLVIMTDHESNMNGVFLGSLAKQVVNHSKIPVMSIRPTEGPYSDTGLGAMWMPV